MLTANRTSSPALVIIPLLQEAGARVAAYDPAAMHTANEQLENVEWKKDAYAAAEGADALVIVTEWNEFRALDLERIGQSMKTRRLIDLRSIYKLSEIEGSGFHYVSIGRPEVQPNEVLSVARRAAEG